MDLAVILSVIASIVASSRVDYSSLPSTPLRDVAFRIWVLIYIGLLTVRKVSNTPFLVVSLLCTVGWALIPRARLLCITLATIFAWITSIDNPHEWSTALYAGWLSVATAASYRPLPSTVYLLPFVLSLIRPHPAALVSAAWAVLNVE